MTLSPAIEVTDFVTFVARHARRGRQPDEKPQVSGDCPPDRIARSVNIHWPDGAGQDAEFLGKSVRRRETTFVGSTPSPCRRWFWSERRSQSDPAAAGL
jgi:hypothetical protein